MFQSLLCWIMVCKGIVSDLIAKRQLFQSLLCWIMVCKGDIRSLFAADIFVVSILVMLDYGL